jgi:hypothetical protein
LNYHKELKIKLYYPHEVNISDFFKDNKVSPQLSGADRGSRHSVKTHTAKSISKSLAASTHSLVKKQYGTVNKQVGTEKNNFLKFAFMGPSATKKITARFYKSLNNKKKHIYSSKDRTTFESIVQDKAIYKLSQGESLDELLDLIKSKKLSVKKLYVIDDTGDTRYVHLYEKKYKNQLEYDIIYRKYYLKNGKVLV